MGQFPNLDFPVSRLQTPVIVPQLTWLLFLSQSPLPQSLGLSVFLRSRRSVRVILIGGLHWWLQRERDRHSWLQSNCTLWRLLPSLTPLIAGLDKVIGNYPQNENKSDPSCFIVLLIHSGERWLEAGRTLAQCSGHGESQWIREGLSPDNEATGNKLFWIRRNLIEVKLNIWTQETINIISIDCSQAAHRDMVVATLHSTELLWAGWQVFISASSKNVYGNETGARFT